MKNIREAQDGDLSCLQDIYFRSRKANFFWEDSQKYYLEDFFEATKDEYVLVYEENQQIKGFISIYRCDNFIHNLFVDPKYFRKQVGKDLLNAGLATIGRPASLKCVSKNTNGLRFYLKNGWEKVAENTDQEPYWLLIYQ